MSSILFIGMSFLFVWSLSPLIIGVSTIETGKRDGLYPLVFFVGGVVMALASYINTTLYCYPSLAGMFMQLCRDLAKRVIEKKTPLMISALVFQCLAAIFAGKVVCSLR